MAYHLHSSERVWIGEREKMCEARCRLLPLLLWLMVLLIVNSNAQGMVIPKKGCKHDTITGCTVAMTYNLPCEVQRQHDIVVDIEIFIVVHV